MSDLHEYFMHQTNKRLEGIDSKLDKLLAFKWQLIGGSIVASAIVAFVVQAYFGK